MKILLTGCNGMLGSSLSEKLSSTNHTTWATGKTTCRLPSSLFHDHFIYHSLDITNSEKTSELITLLKYPDNTTLSLLSVFINENSRLNSSIGSVFKFTTGAAEITDF